MNPSQNACRLPHSGNLSIKWGDFACRNIKLYAIKAYLRKNLIVDNFLSKNYVAKTNQN